ncbi:hypothetical protein EJ05DRAFT_48843 [Pseudovirgaria hyperparasitica]|uniref:Uncharacterized protein n=1 Tax=Pseudovirgaria hyperparasitica TaxID=470096 RepID=A0A6A6W5Y4_9PEZI|nr:uncharacterized protein EJ05DRAFT_48843 [Pseudovirgaria hyperparasitica]KAF2756957.1 hypothetical protein EJ05DRAFT_48843 [Pseudovirgaria hyperparasitica]
MHAFVDSPAHEVASVCGYVWNYGRLALFLSCSFLSMFYFSHSFSFLIMVSACRPHPFTGCLSCFSQSCDEL